MSDCDHSFSGDDICNSCGYSIGYLLINAEQEIAALKAELESAYDWKVENATAYDKLNNAFIDLNLDCDKLKAELARAREALIKIADWNGAWGTFPETNPQWAAMAVMTAREIAHKGEEG